MTGLALPHLLVVLAAIIAMFGVSRLSSQSIESRRETGRAIVVWFVLLAFGASVWLFTVLHHV